MSIEMNAKIRGNPAAIGFSAVSYYSNDIAHRGILKNVSLEVHAGETLVLLGRSGSGKTTLLRLVNRLLLPSGGQVVVSGRPTSEWDAIQLRRGIGYVIQEAVLFPHFTVAENIALVPGLLLWPGDRVAARVTEMLRLVSLDPQEFGGRLPRELSGGQRQRVGVARALAADPPILLMDEPFGALDPVTRAELQREFCELAARLEKAIIFVTHDLREALLIGTHIGLFAEGRLAGIYKPEEFLRSKDAEARPFVDSLNTGESWERSLPQITSTRRKA